MNFIFKISILLICVVLIFTYQNCSTSTMNAVTQPQVSTEQVSKSTCEWPIFPRAQNYLKTKDDGKCDRGLAQQFDGDCENFHWLGLLGDPTVIKDSDGKFKMWYTSGEKIGPNDWRAVIAHAESADGLLWEDPKDLIKDAVPVVPPGTARIDEEGIETAFVLKSPQGGYQMYFSGGRGVSPDNIYLIGRADSPDGRTWVKDALPNLNVTLPWEQPYDAGGFQVGGVLEPSVYFDGGKYHLWYQGFGLDSADTPAFARLGYATSPDGRNWVKRPTPIFRGGTSDFDRAGVGHVNVVRDPNGIFHMFYIGIGLDEILRIGHAKSNNGIDWIRNPNNPIIEGRPGDWDGGLVGGPSALFVGDQLYLYYMGAKTKDFVGVRFARTQAVCP